MNSPRKWRYFVLIASMRTGSNLFEDMVRRSPDVKMLGELFNPGFIGGPQNTDVQPDELANRDKDPMDYLNSQIEQMTLM